MRRWQRRAADPVNRPEVQEGKGAGVEEAHVAGAAGRQAPLQVLLQRRAQVLHEGSEKGDRNPEFEHGMGRSEEHTSELQSLMRISYAVFCLKKKTKKDKTIDKA